MLEQNFFYFSMLRLYLKKIFVTKYIFDWTIFEKNIATANFQFFKVFKKRVVFVRRAIINS